MNKKSFSEELPKPPGNSKFVTILFYSDDWPAPVFGEFHTDIHEKDPFSGLAYYDPYIDRFLAWVGPRPKYWCYANRYEDIEAILSLKHAPKKIECNESVILPDYSHLDGGITECGRRILFGFKNHQELNRYVSDYRKQNCLILKKEAEEHIILLRSPARVYSVEDMARIVLGKISCSVCRTESDGPMIYFVFGMGAEVVAKTYEYYPIELNISGLGKICYGVIDDDEMI